MTFAAHAGLHSSPGETTSASSSVEGTAGGAADVPHQVAGSSRRPPPPQSLSESSQPRQPPSSGSGYVRVVLLRYLEVVLVHNVPQGALPQTFASIVEELVREPRSVPDWSRTLRVRFGSHCPPHHRKLNRITPRTPFPVEQPLVRTEIGGVPQDLGNRSSHGLVQKAKGRD